MMQITKGIQESNILKLCSSIYECIIHFDV